MAKCSNKHPWFKVLQERNAPLAKFLVTMALEVYSDSLWNSLCTFLAIQNIDNAGCISPGFFNAWWEPDAELSECIQSDWHVHYRNAVYYKQLLESIISVDVKRMSEDMLDKSIAFNFDRDGSLNKQMNGNKFTSCWMAMLDDGHVPSFWKYILRKRIEFRVGQSKSLVKIVGQSRQGQQYKKFCLAARALGVTGLNRGAFVSIRAHFNH